VGSLETECDAKIPMIKLLLQSTWLHVAVADPETVKRRGGAEDNVSAASTSYIATLRVSYMGKGKGKGAPPTLEFATACNNTRPTSIKNCSLYSVIIRFTVDIFGIKLLI